MLGISGANYVGSEEPLRSSRYLTSGFIRDRYSPKPLFVLAWANRASLTRPERCLGEIN